VQRRLRATDPVHDPLPFANQPGAEEEFDDPADRSGGEPYLASEFDARHRSDLSDPVENGAVVEAALFGAGGGDGHGIPSLLFSAHVAKNILTW
jgi:hypothetical protein